MVVEYSLSSPDNRVLPSQAVLCSAGRNRNKNISHISVNIQQLFVCKKILFEALGSAGGENMSGFPSFREDIKNELSGRWIKEHFDFIFHMSKTASG